MDNSIKIISLKSGRLKYRSTGSTQEVNTLASPSRQLTRPSIEQAQQDWSTRSELDGQQQQLASSPSPVKSVEIPLQAQPVGGGGAPRQVRKIFEADDAAGIVNPECLLIHEIDTPRIYFKIPDLAASKKFGKNVFSVLQCADISAGDLRVISKFGSWDSLVTRILIECDGPMMLWTRKEKNSGNGISQQDEKPDALHEYAYTILNSCMVKATFPIEKLSMASHMLHLVKVAKTREIANIKELKKNSIIPKSTKSPSKIREGLPEWVNYIPYRWYSASTRRTIEYMMIMYTLLSLLWAMWQLYKHVDFIRAYLKPIVRFIEYYFSIFKVWFQWVDDVFVVLSAYWWNYFKPFFMLLVAALSPLLQLFRPLRGIINIIPYIFDPFIKFFNMVYMFVKPLVLPLKAAFDIVFKLITSVVRGVTSHAMANQTIASLIHRGGELYIVKLVQEALHGHLDPLKAQFIVIRDLILKSSRKIYFGVRFIISRIYFVFIFLRRERDYSKEGEAQIKTDDSITTNDVHELTKSKQD